MKITSIKCNTFDIEGTLFIPSVLDTKYEHTVTLDTEIISTPEVYIVNEKPFVRLPQEVSYTTGNKTLVFYTSLRSFEDSSADILEVVIGDVVLREYLDIRMTSTEKIILTKKTGTIPLLTSNLLYPRIKLGFATWSTVEKNQLSTTTKLLEPLLAPLYDSYFKMLSLTKHSKHFIPYSKTYSIHTGREPCSVIHKNTKQKLHAVSSNERAPVKVVPVPNLYESSSVALLIDPSSSLPTDLHKLTNQLLYVKKSDNFQSDLYFTVYLKGFDEHGNYMEEMVRVKRDLYTLTTKRFAELTDIYTDCPIVITNVVDCRYNHYILMNNMLPPIVDDSLMQFLPLFCIGSHGDNNDKYHLDVINNTGNQDKLVYQFDIPIPSRDVSYFVDQSLRITWLSNGTLGSSVLGHDLSKDIGRHPSVNNNHIVSLANTNTLIGEWAEATISTENWTSKEPMIISIKNKGVIRYYDQGSESFVEGVKYYYPSDKEDDVTISVRVTNEQPYIFSVMTPDLKEQYIAVSYSHKLYDYTKGVSAGTYLIHKDGQLCSASSTNPILTVGEDFNNVQVYVENRDSFPWSCTIGDSGYYFGMNGSTLPEELFTIYQYSGSSDFPVSFRLDYDGILNLLNTDEITINIECEGGKLFYKKDQELSGVLTYTVRREELK